MDDFIKFFILSFVIVLLILALSPTILTTSATISIFVYIMTMSNLMVDTKTKVKQIASKNESDNVETANFKELFKKVSFDIKNKELPYKGSINYNIIDSSDDFNDRDQSTFNDRSLQYNKSRGSRNERSMASANKNAKRLKEYFSEELDRAENRDWWGNDDN